MDDDGTPYIQCEIKNERTGLAESMREMGHSRGDSRRIFFIQRIAGIY